MKETSQCRIEQDVVGRQESLELLPASSLDLSASSSFKPQSLVLIHALSTPLHLLRSRKCPRARGRLGAWSLRLGPLKGRAVAQKSSERGTFRRSCSILRTHLRWRPLSKAHSAFTHETNSGIGFGGPAKRPGIVLHQSVSD